MPPRESCPPSTEEPSFEAQSHRPASNCSSQQQVAADCSRHTTRYAAASTGAGFPLPWHEDDAGTAAARTVAGQRTLRIRPPFFDTRVIDVAFDRQLQWDEEPAVAMAPAPVVVTSDHGQAQPQVPFKP